MLVKSTASMISVRDTKCQSSPEFAWKDLVHSYPVRRDHRCKNWNVNKRRRARDAALTNARIPCPKARRSSENFARWIGQGSRPLLAGLLVKRSALAAQQNFTSKTPRTANRTWGLNTPCQYIRASGQTLLPDGCSGKLHSVARAGSYLEIWERSSVPTRSARRGQFVRPKLDLL